MMIKFMYMTATLFVGFAMWGLAAIKNAEAAIYCYPHVTSTVCFSDQDGRSFESGNGHVKSPNVIVAPQLMYTPPPPAYIYTYPRREVPEQDFGECTLALGCLKRR